MKNFPILLKREEAVPGRTRGSFLVLKKQFENELVLSGRVYLKSSNES